MEFKVLGVQHYDFEDNNGKRVVGNKLHCVNEYPTKSMQGQEVLFVSCNDSILDQCLAGKTSDSLVGQHVSVEFNNYGKPDRIILLK